MTIGHVATDEIFLIFRLIFAEIFGDQLLIIDATNKKIVKS